jgi:hypothetical protein
VAKLLDMRGLDIRNVPHVPWVLPLWVAAKLTLSRAFITPLPRVLLRRTDRIQIKKVVGALSTLFHKYTNVLCS